MDNSNTEKKQEIYVATDVESDGPIPGEYSMLSFGSAAYLPDKTLLGSFKANLNCLPNASEDSDTINWWNTKKFAWEACRKDSRDPAEVMKEYVKWLKSLPGKPVFVGYAVTFDYMFMCWYLYKFTGENPFFHYAIDIKSYAMGMLKVDLRETSKRLLPQRWFESMTRVHIPFLDAQGHGVLFCNMMNENNGLNDPKE